MRIIYTPEFPDQETLTDHYYRALWALRPFLDRGAQVFMPVTEPDVKPGVRPAYFDASLESLTETYVHSFSFGNAKAFECLGDDIVLGWNAADIPNGQLVYCVDEAGFHPAAERYLKPLKRLADASTDSERFKNWILDHQTDRAWLIGTGPNVDSLAFSRQDDDLVIICNSMVRNYDLLETLKPSVIVFSDPVFHSGPASIAAGFRADLLRAARKYGSLLLTQTQDAVLLRSHFPKDVHTQIIGLPTTRSGPILPDFMVSTTARETRNILTLLMFPLAANTARHIHIAGFDGKDMSRLEEKGYFWKHSVKNQYQSDMVTAELAHPAFFQVDFDAYYVDHIGTVAAQCTEAEKQGIAITNHTPSFIPAFRHRDAGEMSLNTHKELPRRSIAARIAGLFSEFLTHVRQKFRVYSVMYVILCGILLAGVSLSKDFNMNLSFVAGIGVLFALGLLLALAYIQFTARRLETRLRRDLTDQNLRVNRYLFERLEIMEKESAGK